MPVKNPRWPSAGLVLIALFVSASVGLGAQKKKPGKQPSQNDAPLSPQELFRRVSPSVFVVEALDSQGSVVAFGSGVAVSPGKDTSDEIAPDSELSVGKRKIPSPTEWLAQRRGRHVVTNKHVLEGAVTVRVRQGRKSWPATLTHLDPDHDLAWLLTEGLKAPGVPVRRSLTLEVGERVYAIGAPEGLELTLSEGLISGLREYGEVRIIQTTAAISHGSSGGGLFDAQGRLVGITTFLVKEGQNLNFALPGEWVLGLEKYPLHAETKPEGTSKAFQALLWFQRGFDALERGSYREAIRAYRKIIHLEPNNATAWYNLGVAYGKLGQYDKTVRANQEAIRLEPNNAKAWYWYNLGVAYRELGQHDKAISAYREAIRLKPDFGDAWDNLGSAYSELGQYEQENRAYQEAIRLEPNNAKRWYNLGISYLELRQADKAISAFQEAIRLRPDYADAWFNLGVVYELQGNRSRVMQVYQRLKQLDPDEADEFFRKVVLP